MLWLSPRYQFACLLCNYLAPPCRSKFWHKIVSNSKEIMTHWVYICCNALSAQSPLFDPFSIKDTYPYRIQYWGVWCANTTMVLQNGTTQNCIVNCNLYPGQSEVLSYYTSTMTRKWDSFIKLLWWDEFKAQPIYKRIYFFNLSFLSFVSGIHDKPVQFWCVPSHYLCRFMKIPVSLFLLM